MKRIALLVAAGLAVAALAAPKPSATTRAAASQPAASQPTSVPAGAVARAELLAELKAAPGTIAKRRERIIALFKQAGLTGIDKLPVAGRPGRFNVFAKLPGETKRIIVVGAHIDHSSRGGGVIDNWSGSAMMTNLAQALTKARRKHTFVFVGFDLEEMALYGSRAFVASLSGDQKSRIDAMVNIDCIGVNDIMIWRTGSADELEVLAMKVAKQASIPARLRHMLGVMADSESFQRAKIPAISFVALDENGIRLIHSSRDRYEAIKPDVYHSQYLYLLRYLLALDSRGTRAAIANKDRGARRARMGFIPERKLQRAGEALIIKAVVPGSPEDAAGMKAGDKVVKFNGLALTDPRRIRFRFMFLARGEAATITVERDGKPIKLNVQY